jgi:hypothetical protein
LSDRKFFCVCFFNDPVEGPIVEEMIFSSPEPSKIPTFEKDAKILLSRSFAREHQIEDAESVIVFGPYASYDYVGEEKK